MDKFSLVVALATMLAGLATAHKLGLGGEEFQIGEPPLHHGLGGFARGLGGPIGGFGGGARGFHGHPGFEGIETEALIAELTHRGHPGLGSGFGAGGIGGGGIGGHPGFRRARFGLRKPFGGAGGLGGGLGGGGGGGAVGGLAGAGGGAVGAAEGALAESDLVGSHNHLGSHKLAEGAEGGITGSKKNFDAGGHSATFSDNAGFRKHKVINSNKVLIKDQTSGVEDVDSFHNVNGVSKGGHIEGNKANLAASASGGKLDADKDLESDQVLSHNKLAEAATGGGVFGAEEAGFAGEGHGGGGGGGLGAGALGL